MEYICRRSGGQKECGAHWQSRKQQQSEAKVLPLSQIEMTYDKRVSTDMKELDRVLGGGIVQGSMVLVGGRSRNRKIHIAASGVQESVGA